MRRVVVTGLGMLTPLGCGVDETWNKLKQGKSGVVSITDFDVSDLPCKIAARIPRGNGSMGTYNPDLWVSRADQRKFDEFIVFSAVAAKQALADADWQPESEKDKATTGVVIGSSIGGFGRIYDAAVTLLNRGPSRVSPFFVPGSLINMANGYLAIAYGFKGPNQAVVTACASGAHAIIDAARVICTGEANVMLACGTEAPVHRLAIAGFSSCRALVDNSFNDAPTKASRPYDRERAGFVLGEGAGALVLEDLTHAIDRKAKIYAEIIGFGLSCDAFHITAPPEDGSGAYQSMEAAVIQARIAPDEIDYINAHGTSTMADEIELAAVEKLFGNASCSLSMSSTKSMTGHLLGAAGAVEAIVSILAMENQIAPPTINLECPLRESPVDLVPNVARERRIDTVLSNSFGFGGTNATIIMRRLQ